MQAAETKKRTARRGEEDTPRQMRIWQRGRDGDAADDGRQKRSTTAGMPLEEFSRHLGRGVLTEQAGQRASQQRECSKTRTAAGGEGDRHGRPTKKGVVGSGCGVRVPLCAIRAPSMFSSKMRVCMLSDKSCGRTRTTRWDTTVESSALVDAASAMGLRANWNAPSAAQSTSHASARERRGGSAHGRLSI